MDIRSSTTQQQPTSVCSGSKRFWFARESRCFASSGACLAGRSMTSAATGPSTRSRSQVCVCFFFPPDFLSLLWNIGCFWCQVMIHVVCLWSLWFGFCLVGRKIGKGENKILGNLCLFSETTVHAIVLCVRVFSTSPLFSAYLDFCWVMVFVIGSIIMMYSWLNACSL
jgi:hypothetical protein